MSILFGNSAVPAPAATAHAEEDRFQTKAVTSVRDWRPGARPDLGYARPAAWIAAILLSGALSACAEYRSYEKCGAGGCTADANITASVQRSFAQHSELEGPDQLYVKTIDHVVYLSGSVETGLHRDIAGSVAREVSGVDGVVNGIAIDK